MGVTREQGDHNALGAESLGPGGAEKSQQCRKYFILYSIHLLQKKLRFENGGAQLVSCPGRHLTYLGTPLTLP